MRWVWGAVLGAALSLALPGYAHAVHGPPQQLPSGVGASYVSDDGTIVTFMSSTSFVPEDTDGGGTDVYQWNAGTFELISTGPGDQGDEGNLATTIEAVSDDGSRVIFGTNAALTSDDGDDSRFDLYERFQGQTTLLSTGPLEGEGNVSVTFAGATPDGTHVYFYSLGPLTPGDDDLCPNGGPCSDLYERAGGTTRLVSTGPNQPAAADSGQNSFPNFFAGVSRDGARVFFTTDEALVAEDTDGPPGQIGVVDVYERAGGQTKLISTSSSSTHQPFEVIFDAVSDDGSRVFFRTQEQLTADDTDGGFDVFERSATSTTRISKGSLNSNTGAHALFRGITPDGTHVFFGTPEALEPDDGDAGGDLYRRSGGQTTLISTGPQPVSAPSDFQATSDDGQRVIFGSLGAFTSSDTDSQYDLYERFAGSTTQISPGNKDDNGFDGAVFEVASRPDATRVIYHTRDGVLPEDTNNNYDLYESWNGRFYRITGPDLDLETGTCCPPSRNVFSSVDAGVLYFPARDRTSGGLFRYVTRVNGPYARPRGATPFQTYLVPAYEPCTAPDRQHGPPLAFGSCSAPTQVSEHLTVGTPDANARPAKSIGTVRLAVSPGAPGGPDDADVQLSLDVTDVREQATLDDYGGALRVQLSVQSTDRDNTPAPTGLSQATGVTTPFGFDAACAPTSDTTVGSTCTASTSVDAVVPGAAKEGQRSIWELGQIEVYDGGSDGDPATAGNTLFAVQGLFVP